MKRQEKDFPPVIYKMGGGGGGGEGGEGLGGKRGRG